MQTFRGFVVVGIIVVMVGFVSIFSSCKNESQATAAKNNGELNPKEYITYQDQLYAIDFVDETFGWTVGSWGAVFHTEDGGKNWFRQVNPTDNYLYSVFFLDRINGWIAGAYGTILHTRDGGKTWELQKSGTEKHLYRVKFVDESEGWAVGYWGAILYTEDGGENWQDKSIKEDIAFSSFSLVEQHLWVVGEFGAIYHTDNKGENWERQPSGVDENIFLYGVDFSNSAEGWAVGVGGTVLRTKNGGSTWQPSSQANEFAENLFDTVIRGESLFAIGERGAIIEVTETPGERNPFRTRQVVPDPVTFQSLAGVCLADQNVWIVGRNGTIFRLDG